MDRHADVASVSITWMKTRSRGIVLVTHSRIVWAKARIVRTKHARCSVYLARSCKAETLNTFSIIIRILSFCNIKDQSLKIYSNPRVPTSYIGAMNERIRRQISISNPFVFKHISNLKSVDAFDDIGPSVVMASPGMMQSGLSRELFETWCTDRRNGVIIAGYCVEGTLAKVNIEIQGMSKGPLPYSIETVMNGWVHF